jgi:hypothetical protein
MSVIHGEGKPKIELTLLGTTINLPYCSSLTERFSNDFIQTKLNNGNINTKKRGYYYSATLDYSTGMSKEVLESLEPLFSTSQNDFYFYPRSDNTNIYYKVNFPENFALEIAQKKFHRGHKNIILEFIGVERLTSVDLTNDPI